MRLRSSKVIGMDNMDLDQETPMSVRQSGCEETDNRVDIIIPHTQDNSQNNLALDGETLDMDTSTVENTEVTHPTADSREIIVEQERTDNGNTTPVREENNTHMAQNNTKVTAVASGEMSINAQLLLLIQQLKGEMSQNHREMKENQSRVETAMNNLTEKQSRVEAQMSRNHRELTEKQAKVEVAINSLTENQERLKTTLGEQIAEVRRQCMDNQHCIQNEMSEMRNNIGIRIEQVEGSVHKVEGTIDQQNTRIKVMEDGLQGQFNTVNRRVDMQESATRTEFRRIEDRFESIEQDLSNLRNRSREVPVHNEEAVASCSNEVHTPIPDIDNNSVPLHDRSNNNRDIAQPSSNMGTDTREGMERKERNDKFVMREIELPTFGNNENENARRYINELEAFFSLRDVPDSKKLSIIGRSLYGTCADWYEMQSDFIEDYPEFRSIFLSTYWGTDVQREIRLEIMHGTYEKGRHGKMCDYAMKLGQKAKFLDPGFTAFELIKVISNHFANEIRAAIIVTKPSNIKELFSLLKDLQPAEQKGRYNGSPKRKVDHRGYEGNNYIHVGKGAERPSNQNNYYRNNDAKAPQNENRNVPKWQNRNGNNNSTDQYRNDNGGNINGSYPQGNQNRGRPQYRQEEQHNVNYINVENDNKGNNYRKPHWWKRRKYRNNNWKNKYYQRSAPYNEQEKNENGGRSLEPGPSGVTELVRRQNDRKDREQISSNENTRAL